MTLSGGLNGKITRKNLPKINPHSSNAVHRVSIVFFAIRLLVVPPDDPFEEKVADSADDSHA